MRFWNWLIEPVPTARGYFYAFLLLLFVNILGNVLWIVGKL